MLARDLDREAVDVSVSAYLRLSTWRDALHAAKVLWRDYGHFRTVATRGCVDRDGNATPCTALNGRCDSDAGQWIR